nr:MAG TPA: hypothetical protein [Caudoviricetes sp.]
MEYVDYGRIQNVQKARLLAHTAVEEKFNKRLNFITWSAFIIFIVVGILTAIGMILLLAAGFHYIWG